MDIDALLSSIAILALPAIFAITLHEAAHGYVAKILGDRTAFLMGRVSLNPLRHIDPIGTILLPLLIWIFSHGSFLFGWAKPVPVDFRHLRRPKQDMLWVALAGPGANLFMALLWAGAIKLADVMPSTYFSEPLTLMGQAGVHINAIFMMLNLLPILPLDGGRIAVSLLPYPAAARFAALERYGLIILVLLLFSGILDVVLWPLINLVKSLIFTLYGLI